ncbi:MAG: cadmium resistance transporter [Geminicoccaceae bacterium]
MLEAPLIGSLVLVYLSTNIDNLALLLALRGAAGRVMEAGYVLAQVLAVVFALIVARGLGTIPVGMIGYLGLIPIGLGVYHLVKGTDETVASASRTSTGLVGSTLTFAATSSDTVAVMVALLTDSTATYDYYVLFAVVIGILALVITARAFGRVPGLADKLARLERIVPFVLIAIGVYVLMNTATDVMPA